MQVESELQQLARFMPLASLMEKISVPLRYLPEPVTALIPSTVVSSDGLTLIRVLLVSARYLCDVRLSGGQGAADFDFVSKRSIKNYRFRLLKQEIKEGESIKASYDIAEIQFFHELGGGFQTEIVYAGDDREGWLARVLEAIPIHIVLESDGAS